MGRSENSRNRIFEIENGEVFTKPFDEEKVADPSLIIYRAVRRFENKLIVTNGDQTDTIYDFLKAGKTFDDALKTRTFEPDSPNFTPRISLLMSFDSGNFEYAFSILKSESAMENACSRYTFRYSPVLGLGHFIHTYKCDGNPIPSFAGEPERIEMMNNIDVFADTIWNSLDFNNKISLYVRYTDVENGKYDFRLINKNKR